MASQESTLDPEGVNVYFVIPNKYTSDKECSDDMWLAYNVSTIQNKKFARFARTFSSRAVRFARKNECAYHAT